jgi:hydroxyacylglutathione hydrolase
VDPYHPKDILKKIKKYGIETYSIINTHSHPDHIQGNQGILKTKQIPVLAHHASKDIPGFSDPLHDKDIIQVDPTHSLEIMETPGHTNDSICIIGKKEKFPIWIITGDTVFNAGVGNCKHGGNVKDLFETISLRFPRISDDVEILPGHDYWEKNLEFMLKHTQDPNPLREMKELYRMERKKGDFPRSTLGWERECNLFFQSKSLEEFSKLRSERDQF